MKWRIWRRRFQSEAVVCFREYTKDVMEIMTDIRNEWGTEIS